MFDFGIANERQKEAVTCTEGPLLIIAGPGTGKTFTLVKRIAYLVFEKGVKPSEIMAITFTEKAAHQLVTRISDEFLRYSGCENINIDEMYIGTFHSVCLRLMKEYSELLPFDADKRIIDSFEQQYMVYNNLERFRSVKGYCRSNFNNMSKWEQAKAICKYTSTMSEELLSRDKLLDDKDADILVIAKVWDEYDKLLTENNATDFSTIQADAWRMMQNSDIFASVREKIRYVMVDEYQDTNHIQEQLILAIGGKHGNICVVGDDDQGLYRFRGATIRNIFEFPKHFGENECRVIKLEENYRSEKGIIDLYNNWMTNPEYKRKFDWGKYRYPKQIYTSKNETYSSVYTCKGTYDEPARVKLAEMIKRMKQNGTVTDYNQIVFLFKSVRNDEAKKTAEFLEESGIPVYTPRSKLYFERAEVKQIIGCLICCFRTFTCFLKQQKDADKPSKISRYYISDNVMRLIQPVGVMFSEYYFYLCAYISVSEEMPDVPKRPFPTIYRIDRIEKYEILDEHFHVAYSDRFQEGEFRKRIQFMFGGELRTVKFLYKGISIEAVLDRFPTANIIKHDENGWLIKAEIYGDGVDIWLRGQGDIIEVIDDGKRSKV